MGQAAVKTILVVDDDESVRESITDALNKEGYNAISVADEERALHCLNEEQVDLVITALNVPAIDGMKLLDATKEKHPGADVIMVADSTSVEMAVEVMKAGAYDLQTKPINIDKLKTSVGRILEDHIIVAQNIEGYHSLDSKSGLTRVVGNSERMQRVYRAISQIAPAMTTVLLSGETGTGKNLAAKAIHYSSPRHDKPFIELSCAALSESIIESELFGHERGAFTSALNTKKGRFELADGGTLLLNDVSDISPYTQVKLLRVLEDKEFERVGGMETIKVDVRLIAATNKSLEEAMREGRFREDLYYRLNAVTIELPPLRQRKEDIPILVESFIREANQLNGMNIKGITDQAMQFLIKYDWPGNVRELRNCIEGMVVMTRSISLGVNDLSKRISRAGDDTLQVDIHVGMSAKDAERELINATLEYTNNNKALAARLLNMGVRTLFRKVKEYENMLGDLEVAKKHLALEGKTLVLAKNGEVIASSSGHGIVDLVRFAEALGDELIGASIADKVVGKAVALLVRYAGINAVYAVTMSESAEATLEGAGIKYSYGKLIPMIMNKAGDDLCPMEKLSLSYDDPAEGFLALKALVEKMMSKPKG